MESLTDRIEKEAGELIQLIDDAGGMAAAIESGFVQRRIEESAYKAQCAVESGGKVIVGVNQFVIDEEERPRGLFRVDPGVEKAQTDKLRSVRQSRDAESVARCLRQLREAAQSDANLMPPVLDAVRAYCSIGEICGCLKEVFGEFRA